MKRPVVADTGPLYAAVDRDDQYHGRAQTELGRLARQRHEVVVAYPTILETYTLLLHRLGNRPADDWLGEVLAGAVLVNPTVEDYRDAVGKVLAFADQAITLFDATVAVLAGRLGCPVWSYDRHFDVMRTPIWR